MTMLKTKGTKGHYEILKDGVATGWGIDKVNINKWVLVNFDDEVDSVHATKKAALVACTLDW